MPLMRCERNQIIVNLVLLLFATNHILCCDWRSNQRIEAVFKPPACRSIADATRNGTPCE